MPKNGDTRKIGGLTEVYRVPPGVWVAKTPTRPLQKPNPDISARSRREKRRD